MRLKALLILIGAVALVVFSGCGKPSLHQRIVHLQHKAVATCSVTKALPKQVKVVKSNVKVDPHGHVHALREGKPFVSHAIGACAPKPVKQKLAKPHKKPPVAKVHKPLLTLAAPQKAQQAQSIQHGQLGCDLSNNDPIYQGFYSIRSKGLTYCWLKDVEGTGFHDQTAAPMRYWADRAGVTVGGYDFGHVCLVSATAEAHFFAVELRADGLTGDNRLQPALDAEYAGNGCDVGAWIREWIATMHSEGFPRVTIYAGCFWWTPRLGSYWPDPKIAAWIPGYPNAPQCVNHAITVHQFTDHGDLGGGTGDENVLNGQPAEILGGPPPIVIPPEVASLNKEAVKFWDRRQKKGHLDPYGKSRLDYDYNRIYQLGWSPHRSGPRNDWPDANKASKWANDDCGKVVHKWDQGKHGKYVQTLLYNMWHSEHDRCHGRNWPGANGWRIVIRLPGNVNPPSSPSPPQ